MLEAIKIIFFFLFIGFNIIAYIVGIWNIGKWLFDLEVKKEEEEDSKLCENCKSCIKPLFLHSKCIKKEVNANFGDYLAEGSYIYCITARNSESRCGKDGKYYESK